MRKYYFLWIFLILLLVLAGCTQSVQSTFEQPQTAADDGAMQEFSEDQGPAQGGILNLFMINPETLNPLTTKNPTVRQLSAFVFDSLFYEIKDGVVENGLAESFSFSQNGLILDIILRDNIFFHDGQALTSDDVAFTIESLQNAGARSLYHKHVADIQSVKAVNRLEVRIVLKNSDERFIEKLVFPVVPQHVFEDWPIEGHSDTLKLIGTGPFKFEAYKDGVISVLRNDSWWYTKVPDGLNHPVWLDGINFRVYADETDLMQAFQKQEIDIAWLEPGDSDSYSKRSDIFYNQYESETLEFLVLSATGKVNSPVILEQFRALILRYLSGYFTTNPLNKGIPAIETLSDYAKENQLIREAVLEALSSAGFTYKSDENVLVYHKDGAKIPVSLSLKYNGLNTDRQAVSDRITAALFEIGIKVTAESASYSEQQTLVGNGKFDMMLLGCKIPLHANVQETLALVKESLDVGGQNAVILPLYRKYGAVLYHNRIRGLRTPFWKDIYNGWQDWYLVSK